MGIVVEAIATAFFEDTMFSVCAYFPVIPHETVVARYSAEGIEQPCLTFIRVMESMMYSTKQRRAKMLSAFLYPGAD